MDKKKTRQQHQHSELTQNSSCTQIKQLTLMSANLDCYLEQHWGMQLSRKQAQLSEHNEEEQRQNEQRHNSKAAHRHAS